MIFLLKTSSEFPGQWFPLEIVGPFNDKERAQKWLGAVSPVLEQVKSRWQENIFFSVFSLTSPEEAMAKLQKEASGKSHPVQKE